MFIPKWNIFKEKNNKDAAVEKRKKDVCLFVWVYGISTFLGYLMPNPFLYK